jgi:hypothetical protein
VRGWCKLNISRVRGWCGSVKLKYFFGAADWTQVCTVYVNNIQDNESTVWTSMTPETSKFLLFWNCTLNCSNSLRDLALLRTLTNPCSQKNELNNQEAAKNLFLTFTCKFWASGKKLLPSPQPPFLTSHANKTGVNLLRIEAAICLHSSLAELIYTWSSLKSYRAKTDMRTLLHWPPVLCTNPLPKHFLPHSCNLCIMQYVNCKVGINCCKFAWTHPRGLLGGIPCISVTRHPAPPLWSNHPTRVPIEHAQAEKSKHTVRLRSLRKLNNYLAGKRKILLILGGLSELTSEVIN